MLNPELAVAAAKNYRILRNEGITIRKTIYLVIGTFCILSAFFTLCCAALASSPHSANLPTRRN
jgi:hypothetical protein